MKNNALDGKPIWGVFTLPISLPKGVAGFARTVKQECMGAQSRAARIRYW